MLKELLRTWSLGRILLETLGEEVFKCVRALRREGRRRIFYNMEHHWNSHARGQPTQLCKPANEKNGLLHLTSRLDCPRKVAFQLTAQLLCNLKTRYPTRSKLPSVR